MERNIVSGIVQTIKRVDHSLSFVTLTPIYDEGWVEKTVPIYMEIGQEYIRRPVDIITERTGFLGRRFKQTIEASETSISIEMNFSLVERINDSYRRLER